MGTGGKRGQFSAGLLNDLLIFPFVAKAFQLEFFVGQFRTELVKTAGIPVTA